MSYEAASTPTAEVLRQVLQGMDFVDPQRMIGDLTEAQAMVVPDGCPYSIAIQVAHTVFWQEIWLRGIDSAPIEPFSTGHDDWPKPQAGEWDGLRDSLTLGLRRACEIALDEGECERVTERGITVGQMLIEIALHGAYHLGQIALIRHRLNAWPPAGTHDGS